MFYSTFVPENWGGSHLYLADRKNESANFKIQHLESLSLRNKRKKD